MKTAMNLTTDRCDLERFSDADDLRNFYMSFGLTGLELMPLAGDHNTFITPDMVTGVHLVCPSDWMSADLDALCASYRRDLEFARRMHAEYVVFHVSQISMQEAVTYRFQHTDEEVIRSCCQLVNRLMDDTDYTFYFLLENQWYPGLTFLRPEIAGMLLEGIRYPHTGFMLDTGHLMNTNPDLRTPDEAVSYISHILDRCQPYLSHIRGIHLNQSLSGAYVKDFLQKPLPSFTTENDWAYYVYEHIFKTDQHRPFVADGVRRLVDRIAPDYVTYEYISRSRNELADFLKKGILL